MKVYVCDACGEVIKAPYKATMKEFIVGVSHDEGFAFPYDTTRKVRVHLCQACYNGLYKVAEEKLKSTLTKRF